MHVRGVCTHVYVDTVTHRLDEDDMCPALSLYLIPLRQGLLLNLELVWQAVTPSPTPWQSSCLQPLLPQAQVQR